MVQPSLVIHGGAGAREGDHTTFQRYADSLAAIIEEAWETLVSGNARDAVLHAVRMLEDEPVFNAGIGSRLQKDGTARMSAALMDGVGRRFSGVVNVERIRHPIDVADNLSEQDHRVLAGEPATRYARETLGMADFDPVTPHRLDEHRRHKEGKFGTVGAVALDNEGVIWAGTSTGGVGYEIPGRMSDSATVAGTYAAPEVGISCTGQGEHIVDHAAAVRVVTRVEDGATLDQAVKNTIAEADRLGLEYGLIALDRGGHAIAAQTSEMTTLYLEAKRSVWYAFTTTNTSVAPRPRISPTMGP